MEWSIQEVVRASGVTSRALRHYDDVGLLKPKRIGANGYRFYDADALVRLQRIRILRQLGLGLPEIGRVMTGETDNGTALRAQLAALRRESERLERQIAAVETTIAKWEGGEQLMAQEMFEGFDHTVYRDEVEERWGAEAYATGDRWWRSLTAQQKRDVGQQHLDIAADYGTASAAGQDPASGEVQAIAQRHYDWLKTSTGTVSKGYFLGLADMYVADPRFAGNYARDGVEYAGFVREAMRAYAEHNL
ncbi:MerR family transcriptional regulator [Planctomonas psychrotolerans]|uniref:MerR family transcriptional regulator n=1 Tax=Planctomonas psychrotolerans TaxID=2528712 RepID=UPI001239C3CE|nr:MerR family transcriptional regulator [Planctomonas psychrotolerans]